MIKAIRNLKLRDRCHLFDNTSGLTLAEVLAGIVVSTILIGLAAVAIMTFYSKYVELSYFADLQQEAYDLIETVKYGYPFEELQDYVFIGATNADSLRLEELPGGWGTYSGIRCIPDRSAMGHAYDFVRYYWRRYDQAVFVEARYGIRYYQEQIFPKRGDDRFAVTEFTITPLDVYDPNNVRAIRVDLKAEAVISDEKKKEISYSTIITRGR